MGPFPISKFVESTVRHEIQKVTRSIVNCHAGSTERLISKITSGLEQTLNTLDLLPAGVQVRVVEEDENMRIVRQIHEEPIDEIVVHADIRLQRPIEYIILEISPGDKKLDVRITSNE